MVTMVLDLFPPPARPRAHSDRPPTRTEIVGVDDLPVVVRGLDEIFGAHDFLQLVGEASTPDAAFELTRSIRPDVVVVPVRLGGSHRGLALCRSIKEDLDARVVLFTSFTRKIDLILAQAVGADGVVSRSAPGHAIVAAVEAVCRGARPVVLSDGAGSLHEMLAPLSGASLTPRETELLVLIAEWRSNEDIAEALIIEVSTVKSHVRSILRKLGASSRRELLTQVAAAASGDLG